MANVSINVPVRTIDDLTIIPTLSLNSNALKDVKIPVGNLPLGISGEAISLGQIIALIPIESIYTKTYATKGEVQTETLRAQNVEATLRESLNVEKARALAAEDILSKAVNAISNGSSKAYATLDEARSAQGSIAANTLVYVSNDPVSDNNGLYLWDGTNLTKSNFDLNESTRRYFEDLISRKPESMNLYEWLDNNGSVLLYVDSYGQLRSKQLDDYDEQTQVVKKTLDTNIANNLFEFKDSLGNVVGYVTPTGDWIIGNIDLKNELVEIKKVQSELSTKLKNVATGALKQYVFKEPEGLIQVYLNNLSGYLPGDKSYKIVADAEFHIDGTSFNLVAELEVQGSSSVGYPKKNYTLGLFSDRTLETSIPLQLGAVAAHDEWIFKANYVDASHVRNIGANNLWSQIVNTRPGLYKNEVDQVFIGKSGKDAIPTNATGRVVGYPVVLYINDQLYGIGSFNIGKKYFNYNLDRSKATQIQIDWGGSQCDLTQLYNYYVNNVTDYKGDPRYEFKSPKKVTNATLKCIQNWDAFAAMAQADFTANLTKYLNKQNVVDYYLFSDLLFNYDGLAKNFQFVSWNGSVFYFMPYDLDSTFGSDQNGTSIISATTALSKDDTPQASLDFWKKIKVALAAELVARYKELRDSGVFTETNVYNTVYSLASKYPKSLVLEEQAKWTTIPSLNFSNVYQIGDWSKQRLAYLDKLYSYTK